MASVGGRSILGVVVKADYRFGGDRKLVRKLVRELERGDSPKKASPRPPRKPKAPRRQIDWTTGRYVDERLP